VTTAVPGEVLVVRFEDAEVHGVLVLAAEGVLPHQDPVLVLDEERAAGARLTADLVERCGDLDVHVRDAVECA
jgi:hypothetical protein